MNELAVQQERNSALDHRLENQIQQMRLDIRKPSADKVLHIKGWSQEGTLEPKMIMAINSWEGG